MHNDAFIVIRYLSIHALLLLTATCTKISNKSESRFRCTFCNTCFPWQKGLSEHILKEHGTQLENGKLQCKLCNVTFAAMRGLRKHAHIHARTKESGFGCNYCKVSFKRSYSYTTHLKTRMHLENSGEINDATNLGNKSSQ